VEVPTAVIGYLRRYCQRLGTHETGGALGGYFRKYGILVISHVMPPSPRNKAGWFWLKRHRGDAQTFVNSVFVDTQGAANYVGEWHTHPEPHPSPSAYDFKMLTDLLKRSKLEIGFLVGIIVGDTGEICLWLQDAAGNREIFPAAVPECGPH
jgi:integrative and conjugative element protein (TIGR02256 family)